MGVYCDVELGNHVLDALLLSSQLVDYDDAVLYPVVDEHPMQKAKKID